jgi:hypothetical protein
MEREEKEMKELQEDWGGKRRLPRLSLHDNVYEVGLTYDPRHTTDG